MNQKQEIGLFKKLQDKILKDTGTMLVNFERTYAGINMRASGAPSWTATVEDSLMEFGGESATELLKRDKLTVLRYSGLRIEII